MTMKIILSAVFAIPAGGFALMGINDDPLSVFIRICFHWLKNRRIMEYRGDANVQ